MLIDPFNITDFNRSEAELQAFLMFTVCVAGKSATQQAQKLEKFLRLLGGDTPFEGLKQSSAWVNQFLLAVRMGQYMRISRAFEALADIDKPLSQITIEELENIPGIGMKTSRFFMLHSRAGVRLACLDTHVLRFLRENLAAKAPKSTPGRVKYRELEKIFLDYCDGLGRSVADVDLEIWRNYARPRTPISAHV